MKTISMTINSNIIIHRFPTDIEATAYLLAVREIMEYLDIVTFTLKVNGKEVVWS